MHEDDNLPVHKELQFAYYDERQWIYNPNNIDKDIIIQGYFQSPKYWKGFESEIRRQFRFEIEMTQILHDNYLDEKPKTIAIHIRRGDHYQNPNYHQIPISYYVSALVEHFPDFEQKQILIFTDDVEYCKVHFECLPNAKVIENLTDIESLCLMSMCDDFIIGHSTFGWWGAYLANRGKVIRPDKIFAGQLKERNPKTDDYWLDSWIEHQTDTKIDLKDVTFTVPVYFDHPDRKENIDLCLELINQDFDTNFIIGEQGSNEFGYLAKYGTYINFKELNVFWRTKMLNVMAMECKTPFVVNLDCDVICPPLQWYLMAKALRDGIEFAYPYDGRFHHVPRHPYYPMIRDAKDIGIVKNATYPPKNGRGQLRTQHSGGAVGYNKESFIDAGLENENFISFAPEDCERHERYLKLEYKVLKIKGAMFHINHYCGVNSRVINPYFHSGHDELNRERLMSKEQLREYVETWQWKINATRLQKND